MRKEGHDLNVLVCAVLLVLLMCGCAKENVGPPPSVAPLPRSLKGYELYSWKAGRAWQFTLITGTNRLKTLAEITSPENVEEGDWIKITAVGVSNLKSVLARLPAGTQISWISARHLDPNVRDSGPRIRRPPVWTIRELECYCSERDLDLSKGR
jgi:hypothetical protein